MSNHPNYSSPTSNELFPAYGRKPISTSSTHEALRRQLYGDEDFYKYNSHTNRLQSPDPFSSNQNSHLPGIRHGRLNEDSNVYRHINRDRYDLQRGQDLGSSQRYLDIERNYQYRFSNNRNLRENVLRNGQMHPEEGNTHVPFSSYKNLRENLLRKGQTHPEDSFLFANNSQNRETYPDYSRSSFSGARDLPLNDYTDKEYSNQSRNSRIETSLQSKEDFASISKDISRQLLTQDIPSSNNMSSLSKGEEILKEIKILQQQQKLQELLNVSLSIAKQMKHSPVLRDIDTESLSNNNSSSKPEIFSDQGVSQPRFQNYAQTSFKSDTKKDGEIANSFPKSPSFDNLWDANDSNIPLNKSGETELSSVNEKKCLSFSNFPSKLVSANEITKTNVTSEVDRQINSFDNKVLHERLDIVSTNNAVSEDNSSSSEWSKSHSIPFFGETADTLSTVNELGLSPGSQNVEENANSASNPNQTNSNENKEIIKSNLEDALETLEIMDPVVGLNFIIENKNSVAHDGSFPFQCKLCNSSITRSLIIEHILGEKHRIRFVKIKDECLYNHITSPLIKQTDKEEEVYKAAQKMEKIYGRGRVVVQDKVLTNVAQSSPGIKITLMKVENHTRPAAFELNTENDLEGSEFRGDASIENEKSTSPDDITSSKVPMSIVETPCHVSSPGNNIFKFSKQVTSNESKINHILVKTEPSIVASPLNHDAFLDRKANVESVLSSNTNSSDDPPISTSLKRSATPLDDVSYKHIKIDQNSCKSEVESAFRDNTLCKDSELNKTSSFESSKFSLTKLLGHMSKWEISSPEEAEMVSKTVDVLLKLLLRYKLQQEAGSDIENVMKSFLSTYLEKSNKQSDSTTNFDLPLKEKNNTVVMEANFSTIVSASEVLPMEVVENKDSIQANSSLPNISNSQEASKCLSDIETTSSKSSDSPASGLQPPPFFCWTKSNTPSASTAPSSAPVPTVRMSWSSPYGSNLGYYQQQAYGGIPSIYQPYTLPMTHCASPVALPVPLASITPAAIVPPLPPPSVVRPPLPLSFAHPPPPLPTEPPLPPPPPSENIPPPPSDKVLPPLPSVNRSAGPSHKVLPPLPTCVPPPPPPLS